MSQKLVTDYTFMFHVEIMGSTYTLQRAEILKQFNVLSLLMLVSIYKFTSTSYVVCIWFLILKCQFLLLLLEEKMLIQRDCQWWKWHNLEQHYGCSNASVLLFSIWTDGGMESFNNFTYECWRQALVFYSERQTDKPPFPENVCSSSSFLAVRLWTHTERGGWRKRETEKIISSHTWHHTYGVIKSEATQYEFQIGFSRSLPLLMYLMLFSD